MRYSIFLKTQMYYLLNIIIIYTNSCTIQTNIVLQKKKSLPKYILD